MTLLKNIEGWTVEAVAAVFFLLVASNALEWAVTDLHFPIRPFEMEGVCLVVSATLVASKTARVGWRCLVDGLRPAVYVLTPLLALGLWMIVRSDRPHSISLALWEVSNTLLGFSFTLFAQNSSKRDGIRRAALAAFWLQVAAVAVDVSFPGTFSQLPERAAGLPMNPNDGAALVVFLTALLMPPVKPPTNASSRSRGVRILLIASAAVIFTLSRSGLIMMAAVWLAFIPSVASLDRTAVLSALRRERLFLVLYAVTLVGLVTQGGLFSVPRFTIMMDDRLAIRATTVPTHVPMLTKPEALPVRPDSVSQRIAAIRFFLAKALVAPWDGYGTGYSMSFDTGPHNMLLALWVDGGLGALALFLAAGIALLVISWRRSSPCLLAIALAAGLNSVFSHTLLFDPELVIMVGAALGMSYKRQSCWAL